MQYYRYQPDANSFSGLGFSSKHDEWIEQLHDSDMSLIDRWVTPVAHGFVDNPTIAGDFPSLSNFWRIPIFSQIAWDVLFPLIGYCCEALPIADANGHGYFVIHVMDTIQALDLAHAVVSRNATTGRVNRVFRYAFYADKVSEKHIFKLPLEVGGELIVDGDFRRTVEMNGLRGLLFNELPLIE